MDLAHRNQLWLLLLVPPLLALAVRCARRRAEQWVALGQGGRLPGDGTIAWLAAIACLVVALAQPRWGRIPALPLPPGRDVVLLVDDSRSMAAEDAVPDRLGVAVEAASSLVNALARQPGNRVGVVAFAGRGVLRCPLTENLGAASDALRALRPGDVRPGGTDLGAGLTAALEAFGNREQEPEQAGGRTVVVFSDGEDHIGSFNAAAARLRDAGIVVHAVAVGDAENGHPIPLGRGEGSLAYAGAPVLSRRIDAALATIAEATGGAVIPLGLAAADLGDLYLKRIEPVARQKRLVFRASERAERYGWFVFAALGLGLGGSWPGHRARGLRVGRWFHRAGLLGLVGIAAGAAVKEPGESEATLTTAKAVEKGRSAYRAGRWPEAFMAFEHAVAMEPRAAVPRYDVAATLFQMQRFADAADAYSQARQTAGAVLRTKIDFALGNTALALGDVTAAIAHYDACLASRTTGSDLDAVRRDAATNRRFAVESAQRRATPPRSGDGSSTAPRSGSSGSERDNEGATDGGGPALAEGAEGPNSPTPGRRGRGGAGGSGSASPEGDSPDERLDSALKRVREARHHRLPESPPQPPSRRDRQEW